MRYNRSLELIDEAWHRDMLPVYMRWDPPTRPSPVYGWSDFLRSRDGDRLELRIADAMNKDLREEP